jgi:hypothetical protein
MRARARRAIAALSGALAALLLLVLGPLIGVAGAAALDFDSLRQLIERDRIDSIEALLADLPEDLRRSYALVFSSRSLQEATFRDPRAILYGSDGRLILTFNGDAAERGYEALESAQYDTVRDRFEFRELRFVAGPDGRATPQVSEANPLRCRRCHGTPARPVWDSSPLWPGAYGERYRSNLTAVERAGLKVFLERQPLHPRYRVLVAAERFTYRSTFAPDARGEYSGEQREAPNAELAELLGGLSMRMIARELAERPDFPRYQYALLGAAEGDCGELAEFLPPLQRPSAEAALRRMVRSAEVAGVTEAESRRARALPGTPNVRLLGAPASPGSTLSEVRLLAESGLGMPTEDWTLSLEKGTYEFSAPGGGSFGLAEALRARMVPGDTHLGVLRSEREHSPDDGYCAYLRARSQAELAGLPADHQPRFALSGAAVPPPLSTAPALLQHCALCHLNGPAPRVPFEAPDRLAALLRSGRYPRGDLLAEIKFRLSASAGAARMPPDAAWPDAERESLSRFIASLADDPAPEPAPAHRALDTPGDDQ